MPRLISSGYCLDRSTTPIPHAMDLKKAIIYFTSLVFWGNAFPQNQTIAFKARLFGYQAGGQLTLDLYKTYAPFYLHLERNKKPTIWRRGDELDIYSILSRRIIFPRYLVMQFTCHPLAGVSSYLETDQYEQYQRFNVTSNFNVLRSFGAGYDEPFAFSILFGNIIFLAHEDSITKKLKQSGSALAGVLVSLGNHQIYNNIYLHDRWHQFEFILTGNLQDQRRKLAWNFRLGVKRHQNNFFTNEFTMAMERTHSDRAARFWSLARNSILKIHATIPIDNVNSSSIPRYLILFGKKLPLTLFKYRMFATLSFGAKWERIRNFNHDVKHFEPTSSERITWLIQPNVEF